MLVCDECNETFVRPHVERECIGEYWGSPAYQTFAYCPYCGSTLIREYVPEDGEEVESEEEYELRRDMLREQRRKKREELKLLNGTK